MFRAGLVEEIGRKELKPLVNSIVRAVKASGQSCNILSIYDEMVQNVLFTYLINRLSA